VAARTLQILSCRSGTVLYQHIMHFYVTGYKFGMMVLVSLSFSRCVNFVGRGQVLVLVLVLNSLVLITTLVFQLKKLNNRNFSDIGLVVSKQKLIMLTPGKSRMITKVEV